MPALASLLPFLFSRFASASGWIAVVLLLLVLDSVRAQIDTPDCTDTDDWSWVSKALLSFTNSSSMIVCDRTQGIRTNAYSSLRSLVACVYVCQSYNSLNQNPCKVAAYLEAVCNSGRTSPLLSSPFLYPCQPVLKSNLTLTLRFRRTTIAEFSVPALLPGNHYTGPSVAGTTNLCKCNTVVYSLVSACGGCQGGEWIQCVTVPIHNRRRGELTRRRSFGLV